MRWEIREGERMRIEKIKAIKCCDQEGVGPSEIVTLGLKCDGVTIIFGSFYFGPHMLNSHSEMCRKQEAVIDYIVKVSEAYLG